MSKKYNKKTTAADVTNPVADVPAEKAPVVEKETKPVEAVPEIVMDEAPAPAPSKVLTYAKDGLTDFVSHKEVVLADGTVLRNN